MEVSALKYSGGIGLHGRSPLLRLQSDERLVALVRRGSAPAFEMLVSRYDSRLMSFCRHLLGSREDAEDVLQEVFAAAYNAMLGDDRPINVKPWLYRIARNRSLNHLRRAQALAVDSMDVHLSEFGATTADKVHEREEFRLLVDDIRGLPETQRTALVLREMDALSYEQIAEAMETTVPSVKSLLVRARVSLAEAAEARLLSCDEVRTELGEVAEGLLNKPSPLVRRHLRSCQRCTAFQSQLKETNRALAALMPLGPLIVLKKLALAHLGHSAGSGATAAGSGAATSGGAAAGGAAASSAAAGSAAAGVAAGGAGLVGSGGFVSAGLGALATKAAAGLAAAALVTAGAVEVDHSARSHASRTVAAATSTGASPTSSASTGGAALGAPQISTAVKRSRPAAKKKQKKASKKPLLLASATPPPAATTTTPAATTPTTPTPAPGRVGTTTVPTVLSPSDPTATTGTPTDGGTTSTTSTTPTATSTSTTPTSTTTTPTTTTPTTTTPTTTPTPTTPGPGTPPLPIPAPGTPPGTGHMPPGGAPPTPGTGGVGSHGGPVSGAPIAR